MPFDTLSSPLQDVALKSVAHCKRKFGVTTASLEQGISPTIQWRPSFFLKPSRYQIVAVEVDDNLYPSVLREAVQDIIHYDVPISVYQACSLDAYLSDPRLKNVEKLKKRGLGIITVDDEGNVVFQHSCVPLGQFISDEQYEREASTLNSQIRRAFNAAFGVYQGNPSSGLQRAGQIVEGLVNCLAERAVKNNLLLRSVLGSPSANIIDQLYALGHFSNHRAALGGARDFMKEYRNVTSHAPKSAKQAAERDRNCRGGFIEAIKLSIKLQNVARAVNYPIKLHLN